MIFGTTYLLLWLVVVVQTLVIFVLMRQVGELRDLASSGATAPSGLPIGTLAPEFQACELPAGRVISSSTFRGRRTVLCFVSTDCPTCRSLIAGLSKRNSRDSQGLVVYCNDTEEGCRRLLAATGTALPILCRDQSDVAGEFLLATFPVAIVIDESGRIRAQRYPFSVDDLLSWSSTELAEVGAQPLAATPT